jgi:hypothetical protein
MNHGNKITENTFLFNNFLKDPLTKFQEVQYTCNVSTTIVWTTSDYNNNLKKVDHSNEIKENIIFFNNFWKNPLLL